MLDPEIMIEICETKDDFIEGEWYTMEGGEEVLDEKKRGFVSSWKKECDPKVPAKRYLEGLSRPYEDTCGIDAQ